MMICIDRLAKVLRGAPPAIVPSALRSVPVSASSAVVLSRCGWRELAPHLPADPEQQHAAGEQQADERQQLRRDQREDDAQHGRGDDADQDRLARAALGQAGRGEPMTMALSPASTRSIMMTWKKAERAAGEKRSKGRVR